MQAVQLLLAAPHLKPEVMAGQIRAAVLAGRSDVAIVVLKALVSRDRLSAAAVLASRQSVATAVLRQWRADERVIRKQEAQWPALQQLLIGMCLAHQQLREDAAVIIASAVTAAVQAAAPELSDTRVQCSLMHVFRRGCSEAASKAVPVAAAIPAAVTTVIAATVVAFVGMVYLSTPPAEDLGMLWWPPTAAAMLMLLQLGVSQEHYDCCLHHHAW